MTKKIQGAEFVDVNVSPIDEQHYVFSLYIAGTTPHAARALVNIRKMCEKYLSGRYELEVVDIAQNPERAKEAQIIAAPTLIKRLPLPLRRFIGDMSHTEKLLMGLDLSDGGKL